MKLEDLRKEKEKTSGIEEKVRKLGDLQEKLEEANKALREKLDTKGGEDREKEEIKGFHAKNVPKPEKIDIDGRNLQDFHAWHDLLIASLSAIDAKWEKILKLIEDKGKEKKQNFHRCKI